METPAHRGANRRTNRIGVRWLSAGLVLCATFAVTARADIPWPEVKKRVAQENAILERRPQGHAGEYFVVCTLYYTPMESGFTTARGFNATPTTRPGLKGRRYPRDFLSAVKKEGFGRLRESVNGCNYMRYSGGRSYSFAKYVTGRSGDQLAPRFSAATRRGQRGLGQGVSFETSGPEVKKVFGSTHWKVIDTGGGLRRWQIDLYWGEDEPLGPGRMMARPRGTEFEYGYSMVQTR